MILIGLAIMVVSQAATFAGVEPFASWNTPICWTGFILFADGIVYRARGNSWIRSAPREFAALCLASIASWLVFEGYNLVIRNWIYVGLPKNPALRLFGYAWSFATISPAIFQGAELAALARAGGAGKAGKAGRAGRENTVPKTAVSIVAGALMLIAPFLAREIAPYLAAPVFVGFIFLLDPLTARMGGETLTRERTINLLWSGALCGVLWEFWNYWARARWIYIVPIMQEWKIFEMPLPGYLGFPPFAVECFTMYAFVRALWVSLTDSRQRGRTIAL